MNRILLLLIGFSFYQIVFSQNNLNSPAIYPGGEIALKEYIQENTIYPSSAKAKLVEGFYFICFNIDTNGKALNPKIEEGMRNCNDCEKEAFRVINSMPKWAPELKNGKKVISSRAECVNVVFESKKGNVIFLEGGNITHDKSYQEEIDKRENVSENKKSEVYAYVEEMPTYLGGNENLKNDISKNIIYNKQTSDLSGNYMVKFVVDKNGNLIDPEILKGIKDCNECDLAVLNAIKKIKKFNPGKQDGKPVDVYVNVMLKFENRK